MSTSPLRLEKAYTYWGFRGCVVPDCSRPPRLHHIVPRREGGTNGRHNLLPVCALHEGAVHKAGAFARKQARAAGVSLNNEKERRDRLNAQMIQRLLSKSHAAAAVKTVPLLVQTASREWWVHQGRRIADRAYEEWLQTA